jgi:putative colanic acid biosynthesis glycosyltransferase
MISIVTVTYNNLPGLVETAQSIESQEFSNFRWIVVDGASTDGSQDFVSRSYRMAKLISEPDRGIYDAMRKGLEAADTEYVLFLNAGDVLHGPGVLAAACGALSGHDVYFFDTEVESKRMSWRRVARPLQAARYSVPAIQQSTIYSVRALKRVTWPTGYRICGDYSLVAQLLALGATSRVVHEYLSRFRLGGVSTHSVFRLCVEASRVQRECLSVPLPLRICGFLRRITTGYVVALMHFVAQRSSLDTPPR